MRRTRLVAAAAAMGLLVGVVPAVTATAAEPSGTSGAPSPASALPAPPALHEPGVVPETGPIAPVDQRVPATPTTRTARRGPADVGLVPPGSARSATDRVVEITHDGDAAAIERLVVGLGGRVNGTAGDVTLEATVRRADIAALQADPHVVTVATPALVTPEASTATTGQEVGLTNANDWHAAGITGAGVKVGIIDSFSQSAWSAAQASGDVPAVSGTFCRYGGTACNIWGESQHGVAVAEIVHEMAPGVQLYLASVGTAADFQGAIDYFYNQGVKVVTRSQTAVYDGPGNGTGPLASVIESAVGRGMVYLNSAGNSAGGGGRTGSYWRGTWSDPDGNGWMNFGPGDEMLRTRCWYFNGVRWDDWGADRTDYDVYLFHDNGDTLLGESERDQTAGATPVEGLNHVPCTANSYVNIAIRRFGGGPSAGDVLETMVNGVGVEYWQNAYSASAPMADSANDGMLAVGAVDPPAGPAIASYSSQGPTNDGRKKPDLSASACVASASYAPNCFNGTSAATPVAAGAAALIWASGPYTTPAGVAAFLRGQVVDRGAAGTDNVYGTGQLLLDPPHAPTPYSSWAAFTNRQHTDLLGRTATASERARWGWDLGLAGVLPQVKVAGLRTSSDNTTYVDPVARLYWAYFLRIPDRDGMNYWIARRRTGTSLATISQGFAASAEFRTLYPNLSNQAFVDRVYQNVLGRNADAEGLAYWTAQLNSGVKSRGSVMIGFSEAIEYRNKMRGSVDVAVLASALLKRKATTAEVNEWKTKTTTQIAQWALLHPSYVKP